MTDRICILIASAPQGLTPPSKELLTAGRRLADLTGGEINCLVFSDTPEQTGAAVAGVTGCPVTVFKTHPGHASHPQAQLSILLSWARDALPAYLLMAHTPSCLELGPGLAARLGSGCITAINGIEAGPIFLRAILGGQRVAKLRPGAGPTVLTLQPGTFAAQEAPAAGAAPAKITILEIPADDCGVTCLPPIPPAATGSDLSDAQVVVAAGRGFTSTEALEPVYTLASRFHQGVAAGSRPMIDQGFMPYSRQVGITGAVVAPRLYLALGISGSTQHIAGMRQSDYVIAVNTDPHAAIFGEADLGIVADVHPFLERLNQKLDAETG